MNNISVIVPVCNEENNLLEVLLEIFTNLKKDFKNFEIIIVDDHSIDNSLAIANNFASSRIHNTSVIAHKKNHGSGKAIYTGISIAKYDLIIYIPADGQFDCTEIIKYANTAQNAEIVLGVRSNRFDYSLFRKLSSYIFILSFNLLFQCNYSDINWIHLWKKKIFKQININSQGVFFLGELIVKAQIKGFRIKEIPSTYRPRKSGTAKGGKISSIIKAIIEMIHTKISLHYNSY